jgi:hypothetical protein
MVQYHHQIIISIKCPRHQFSQKRSHLYQSANCNTLSQPSSYFLSAVLKIHPFPLSPFPHPYQIQRYSSKKQQKTQIKRLFSDKDTDTKTPPIDRLRKKRHPPPTPHHPDTPTRHHSSIQHHSSIPTRHHPITPA